MMQWTVTATDKDGNDLAEVTQVFTDYEEAYAYWQIAEGYEVTMTPKVIKPIEVPANHWGTVVLRGAYHF
jgi:hypothetical protein